MHANRKDYPYKTSASDHLALTFRSSRFLGRGVVASEALVSVDILAVPTVQLVAAVDPNINIRNLKVVATAGGRAALERPHVLDVLVDGAGDIPPRDAAHLELGRVAVPARPARVVLALPAKEGLLAQAANLDVLHGDVGGEPDAAAAAVGRDSPRHAGPGLEVRHVGGVDKGEVSGVEVVDVLVLAVELSHGADGDALAAVEDAVVDVDEARVALESDGVVAVGDPPAAKGDVIRGDGVTAVGVEGAPAAVGGAVDVDVAQLEVARVGDGHGPHLALDEAQASDDRVAQPLEVDVDGPVRQVALRHGPVVPELAVAVERADAKAVKEDVVAAKVPRGALVLEADGHGHAEPVVDVAAPLQAARQDDLDVDHIGRDHGRVDVIHLAGHVDEAFLAADLVEGLHDHGCVVALQALGPEDAELAAFLLGNPERQETELCVLEPLVSQNVGVIQPHVPFVEGDDDEHPLEGSEECEK